MAGGLRLFCSLSSLMLVVAALYAANDSKSSKDQSAAPTAPPDTPAKPVIDILHGTKVLAQQAERNLRPGGPHRLPGSYIECR